MDRITDEHLDDIARRVAIRLMALNEALEIEDAQRYSMIPASQLGWKSPRWHRISLLRDFYRNWFTNVAGGLEQGNPDKGDRPAEGFNPPEATNGQEAK